MPVGLVQLGSGGRGEEDLPAEVSKEMEAHRSCPDDRNEEG